MSISLPQALAIFAFLIVVCGSGLATAITWNQFRVCVELYHPALRKDLGSPAFSGVNPVGRHRLAMFILSGRFRNVGDLNLSKLGNRARATAVLQLGVIVLILTTVFVLSRLAQ
jgi:hypothetical protein